MLFLTIQNKLANIFMQACCSQLFTSIDSPANYVTRNSIKGFHLDSTWGNRR